MSEPTPRHPSYRQRLAPTPGRRYLKRVPALLLLTGITFLLTTCGRPPDVLSQVRQSGILRVATVNSATTYFVDRDGPKGFEYDLARRFADALGVRIQPVVVTDRQAIVRAVHRNRAQMGIGLSADRKVREQIRFTPAYLENDLVTVYHRRHARPRHMTDLSGHLVLPEVPALVAWIHRHYPDLQFTIDHNASPEELMERVAHGNIDATIANKKLVAMNQRYHTSLRMGFTLQGTHMKRTWVLARHPQGHSDNTLYPEALDYLQAGRTRRHIQILDNRYFGHARQLGFVGGAEFERQIKKRLGRWRAAFERAGHKYDVDWRLLAAIGYQESRWDERAVSPTYVHGLMMLTRDTAKHTGTRNRRDPHQSIDGGTRYLLELRTQLPESIKPPDRTWFALAAYNLGLGHVLDARHLLERAGRDPDIWLNLKEALGWLSQQKHARHTRHGYAPGTVAATYVSNIRAYYDILRWMTRHEDSDDAATGEHADPAAPHRCHRKHDRRPDIRIQSPVF